MPDSRAKPAPYPHFLDLQAFALGFWDGRGKGVERGPNPDKRPRAAYLYKQGYEAGVRQYIWENLDVA